MLSNVITSFRITTTSIAHGNEESLREGVGRHQMLALPTAEEARGVHEARLGGRERLRRYRRERCRRNVERMYGRRGQNGIFRRLGRSDEPLGALIPEVRYVLSRLGRLDKRTPRT